MYVSTRGPLDTKCECAQCASLTAPAPATAVYMWSRGGMERKGGASPPKFSTTVWPGSFSLAHENTLILRGISACEPNFWPSCKRAVLPRSVHGDSVVCAQSRPATMECPTHVFFGDRRLFLLCAVLLDDAAALSNVRAARPSLKRSVGACHFACGANDISTLII